MTRRMAEILTVVAVIVLSVFCYVGTRSGWFGPVAMSGTVSVIVVGLIMASLLWILIRTIKGKPAERRIVFLFVGLAVSAPLFMTLTQKIIISPEAQTMYNSLEALKPGSIVLASFDYDPSSAAELQPMAETFFRYCFDHKLKVIIMGLWPQGPQQARRALTKILGEPEYQAMNLQYGRDFVNIGFQSGNEFVIQRMGTDFKAMFPVDFQKTPYDSLELLKGVKNFSNVDYVFNLSAGYPGTKEWVLVGVDQFGFVLGAGNTAVQTTGMYPYIRSNQLHGILGGMNGAAEFEKLYGHLDKGTKYMLSQSFAHVIVIGFIIIGNVSFFMFERKRKRRGF
jgi:hypothetical protein